MDPYEALCQGTRPTAGSEGLQDQSFEASGHGSYPSVDNISSKMGEMHVSRQWYNSSSGYGYDSSYGYGYGYGQGYHQEPDLYQNEATSWEAWAPQQPPQSSQLFSGQSSQGSSKLLEWIRRTYSKPYTNPSNPRLGLLVGASDSEYQSYVTDQQTMYNYMTYPDYYNYIDSAARQARQQQWQDSSTSYGWEELGENQPPEPAWSSWWW